MIPSFLERNGAQRKKANSHIFDHSWTVTRAEIEARGYDLKAVNPHRKVEVDERTPDEILDAIEAKGREVAEALSQPRK